MPSSSTVDVPSGNHEPKPWRRWIGWAVIIYLVGTMGYRPLMIATAERRVHKICAALTPGMSMTDVQKFASAHGMNPPAMASTGYFIGEEVTSNWNICNLEFKDGKLQSSTYFDFGKRKWLR